MARIAGVNIPNHQHTEIALTAIYGIGRTRAQKICDAVGVKRSAKIKELTDSEMDRLREEVAKFTVEGDLRRETTMNLPTSSRKRSISLSVSSLILAERLTPTASQIFCARVRPIP